MDMLTREPVRAYLYSVSTAVVALLVALGILTSAVAPVIMAVVAAVLAVGGVEAARAKVTPTAKLEDPLR
jgi:hypothetical protein